MYVIVDMEWAVNHKNHTSPTQIAALRTDADWNTESSFSSLIRPQNESFHDFKSVAYSGAAISDFLYAKSAYTVFSAFLKWLGEDDILCWWHRSADEVFRTVTKLILKTEDKHSCVFLRDYLRGFLCDGKSVLGSPYDLAKDRQIPVPAVMHHSENDAEAIRNLLKGVSFPQSDLMLPPKSFSKFTKDPEIHYIYDIRQNLLHTSGCPQISEEVPFVGYTTLETPLRKRYKPCSCAAEEFRSAKKERLLDEIRRTQYNYIYTENSRVFHRSDCGLILNAWHILGSEKYETAAASGRIPCKICRPSPDQTPRPIKHKKPQPQKAAPRPKSAKDRRLLKEIGITVQLPKEEMDAVSRLQASKKARNSGLAEKDLSSQSRKDIMTISQPGLAFFAAAGYRTFHLRSCNKLSGKSGLRGFDAYEKAVGAGYSPCRFCHPTKKNDVRISIPIDNRIRPDETPEILDEYCAAAGYKYRISPDKTRYDITTPVGKWIIYLTSKPIHVDHINLISTPGNTSSYHKQPRMFLSLYDTVHYIKRHDDTLTEKKANGTDVGSVDDDADDFAEPSTDAPEEQGK